MRNKNTAAITGITLAAHTQHIQWKIKIKLTIDNRKKLKIIKVWSMNKSELKQVNTERHKTVYNHFFIVFLLIT